MTPNTITQNRYQDRGGILLADLKRSYTKTVFIILTAHAGMGLGDNRIT
jgi:hypothetical protein